MTKDGAREKAFTEAILKSANGIFDEDAKWWKKGFDAGWEARDAVTCVWKEGRPGGIMYTACGLNLVMEPHFTFCPKCAGHVAIQEAE